jgi:hypothetical protein
MELNQVYCKPVPGVTPYKSESSWLESHLCRTHNSVEMAYKFRETTDQTEIMLPEEFKEYKLVFSDEEAKKLPPRQDYNHKIELTKEAPKIFNFKPYLLNPAELEFKNQFLQENLGSSNHQNHNMGSPPSKYPRKIPRNIGSSLIIDHSTKSLSEMSTHSQIYSSALKKR